MRTAPGRFTALAFAALFSLASWAQYPSRPIKLIVPIPPGGAPDISARVIGQRLSELVGQPVVVENRPGSNGNIAMDLVAKSTPDGYTLGLLADSMIAVNPHLYKEMQTDPLKDLAPVASVVSNQWVLSVNPSVPVKNFREFVEYARQARPPLAYASGGNGSIHQLAMEMLKQRASIDLIHVPYKGGAPAATATVAGEVAAMFSGTSSAPQIKAGRLRALAVTGSQRSALFPDLPRLRGHDLAGLVCRSGDPGGGARRAPRRGQPAARRDRNKEQAQRRGWAGGLHHYGSGVHGLDPARLREVRKAGERRRRQGGLAANPGGTAK